jgi:hypothetical protein
MEYKGLYRAGDTYIVLNKVISIDVKDDSNNQVHFKVTIEGQQRIEIFGDEACQKFLKALGEYLDGKG